MGLFSSVIGGSCGILGIVLIVGTVLAVIGLNIWAIVLASENLTPDCSNDWLGIYLDGSLAASASVFLADLGGFGSIFRLVWAILGQVHYNDISAQCGGTDPSAVHAMKNILIVQWVTISSTLAVLIGGCFTACGVVAFDN